MVNAYLATLNSVQEATILFKTLTLRGGSRQKNAPSKGRKWLDDRGLSQLVVICLIEVPAVLLGPR